MTGPSPITIDDEVVSLARRYRKEALASLVTVLRDESAPASARAQASAKLLEYSDGKPGQARQITIADVSHMPDELRQQLLDALLGHYMPNGQRALLKAACDEAVARAGLSLRVGFVRGPKAQAALNPPPASAVQPQRSSAQAELEPAAYAATAEAPPSHDSRANALTNDPPDNVVPIHGDRPAFGIRYGTADTLDRILDTTPSNSGGIPPDVVRRSALKDPLDPWRRR